ncbi:MAG TPA: M48 family metallopeptidase [Thermoanaerobaculia bacterium]|nr:M48 family metallopeptidase [Thermoanaerobaculia bacterium]
MKQSRLALSFVLVLVLGCGGSGGDFNLISLEEEWQLGQQLSQDIARQVPLNNDPTVNAYIRQMGQRIVSQTNMANLPWNFHVVNDNEINAFAIPGGHVYIHTGLINAASNASEVAGVMAHEISHVLARHSTEQISRQYGISVLAGLVLGQNPGVLQQLAAQIVAGGALARFSRAAEEEADALGLQAMNLAGYNPNGMVTMFQKLMQNRRSSPGAVERFFSTHPLTEDRIQDTQRRIQSLPQRSTITNDAGFDEVKARV